MFFLRVSALHSLHSAVARLLGAEPQPQRARPQVVLDLERLPRVDRCQAVGQRGRPGGGVHRGRADQVLELQGDAHGCSGGLVNRHTLALLDLFFYVVLSVFITKFSKGFMVFKAVFFL